MFQALFTTQVSDALRFRSFSPAHWLLVLVTLGLVAFTAMHVQKKDGIKKEKILKGFTWMLPVIYGVRFTVFFFLDLFVEPQMSLMDRLPLQLCTMNAIIMPIGVMKKNDTMLNYMYAICMPGAVAAMLTPAMSYYGKYAWFSWQVIFFFLDHGMMALVSVLTIVSGYVRPNIKKGPKVLGIFGLYALCVYPLNKLLDQNFLFINYPDEGTVMAYFARYLGTPGYLLPLGALVVLVVSLMYLPWYWRDRKRSG